MTTAYDKETEDQLNGSPRSNNDSPLIINRQRTSDLELQQQARSGKTDIVDAVQFNKSIEMSKDEERRTLANATLIYERTQDRPVLGVIFYSLYTACVCTIMYSSKEVFRLNPDLMVFQVTAVKATIAFLIVLITQNVNLKKIAYDQVDRQNLPALIFKTLQGSTSVYLSFTTLKCFNVSTVGIVCSLMPLLVCLFAACLLGERVKILDYVTIVFITSAVLLVILGAQGTEKETMQTNWIAVLCLIAQPFLLAGGAIACRLMRKMHPMVVSTYTNFFLAMTSYIAVLSVGLSFSYILDFSMMTWMMFALIASATIGEQTFKFLAFRYQEAHKLQKLAFLPNVWQFTIDLLFVNKAFGNLQYVGFAVLFLFYTIELVRFFCVQQRNKKKQLSNKKKAEQIVGESSQGVLLNSISQKSDDDNQDSGYKRQLSK